jgi:transcriptional regulator with XRE-family HTH domain
MPSRLARCGVVIRARQSQSFASGGEPSCGTQCYPVRCWPIDVRAASAHMSTIKRANQIDKHLGLRLRMRRLALRMSQTALADSIGVTFQQVQKYENGTNRISASTLQKLSETLHVPIADFFDGLSRGPLLDVSNMEWMEFLSVPEGRADEGLPNIESKEVRRALVDLAVLLGSKR